MAMALLIGIGIGYLLGVKGFGQKVSGPGVEFGQQQFPQQRNFGPGPQGQGQQQGGNIQQPLIQGEAPAGASGGRNPVPSDKGQPVNQPLR